MGTLDEAHIIRIHEPQFTASGIPREFWGTILQKLFDEVFDAGGYFRVTVEEGDDGKRCSSVVATNRIDLQNSPPPVFLIDHAWLFEASKAASHLSSVPGLLERMSGMMGVPPDAKFVLDELWRYARPFSVESYEEVEKRLPMWYIMDEFGCSIQHSDMPNCRLVPFVYAPQGTSYTLLIPLCDIEVNDEVTCDYVEGIQDPVLRRIYLTPWHGFPPINTDFKHFNADEDYFKSGCGHESLPIPKDYNLLHLSKNVLSVYSDYSFIQKYLNSPHFRIVDDPVDADILWYLSSFKTYEHLSRASPNKFINQFPYEHVVTVKDLLSIICRFEKCQEDLNHEFCKCIQPTTYNSYKELPEFVSYFHYRSRHEFDNTWICKPFNLSRGLDIFISNNLSGILKMAMAGKKIIQKYLEYPLLFLRPGIGLVKFDVRYVLLLKCVKPLEVYVYNNFFLRFANKPFEMSNFHQYETHFTVMNYSEESNLFNLLCCDFKKQFEEQYPDMTWDNIESSIFDMIKRTFVCATSKEPPMGIAPSPQSRAVYALDIMLVKSPCGDVIPKLLEVNWMPDCQRACEFYPDFYNNVFDLLFCDAPHSVFTLL